MELRHGLAGHPQGFRDSGHAETLHAVEPDDEELTDGEVPAMLEESGSDLDPNTLVFACPAVAP